MHRWRHIALLGSLIVSLVLPGVAFAAGTSGPPEPCVPGTVWEDPASGITYICIYDEAYGGPRWDILPTGQVAKRAWLSRSSSTGCALGSVGLTSRGGSGASMLVRSYRWPCSDTGDRYTQPAHELRARIVIQEYGSSWTTCRDSGYAYNTGPSWSWSIGIDMGGAADCGSGYYRALGFGSMYQGGAWRGGSFLTPSLFLR